MPLGWTDAMEFFWAPCTVHSSSLKETGVGLQTTSHSDTTAAMKTMLCLWFYRPFLHVPHELHTYKLCTCLKYLYMRYGYPSQGLRCRFLDIHMSRYFPEVLNSNGKHRLKTQNRRCPRLWWSSWRILLESHYFPVRVLHIQVVNEYFLLSDWWVSYTSPWGKELL